MPCAYNAALEASISDLGQEESPKNLPILHRSTCKIFVRVFILLISVTGSCESTKWAANSYAIAIGVPFELNSNLDGNSASSDSFSDDFMTAGSFRCDGISILPCLSRSICTVRMERSRSLWTVASLPNSTIQNRASAPSLYTGFITSET